MDGWMEMSCVSLTVLTFKSSFSCFNMKLRSHSCSHHLPRYSCYNIVFIWNWVITRKFRRQHDASPWLFFYSMYWCMCVCRQRWVTLHLGFWDTSSTTVRSCCLSCLMGFTKTWTELKTKSTLNCGMLMDNQTRCVKKQMTCSFLSAMSSRF